VYEVTASPLLVGVFAAMGVPTVYTAGLTA
jgi:hypothetical protein